MFSVSRIYSPSDHSIDTCPKGEDEKCTMKEVRILVRRSTKVTIRREIVDLPYERKLVPIEFLSVLRSRVTSFVIYTKLGTVDFDDVKF